jgi:glycosyltransferase involved in cell wall biosynthesis
VKDLEEKMNEKIIKICFIDPKFLRSIGGVETHGYEFIKSFFNQDNYKIDSIISCKDVTDGISLNVTNEKFEDRTKRILIKNLTKDSQAILDNSAADTKIYFFNNPNWILSAELIKKLRPDSKIFVRSGGNDIMAGWILDENCSENNLEDNRKKLVFAINHFVDKLIVNSNYSKTRMLSIGVKEEKIVIISGGVDCKLFCPKKNRNGRKIKIAFWGRLVEFKGLNYSLRAIKEIYKSHKNIEFILIGDGPEKNKILSLISELGLKDIVKFKGIQFFSKIPEIVRDVDIFLHLPIYLMKRERGSQYIHTETMGRTYCEASSMGIPSVVSNVGGSPEMILNNITGFVVHEKDFIGASIKLKELIENKKLRDEMSSSARKIALEEFDWRNLIEKYKEIF